jgi:hypothetical protein
MNPESVLEKTTKGAEEIETRKHKLDAKLRPILIAVNGKLSAAELMSRFASMGDAGALLDDLVKQGFVKLAAGSAPATADDPATVRRVTAEIARSLNDALGPDAESFAVKVEAAKSLAEVKAFLDSRRELLESVMGKQKAVAFWQKAAQLLG